MTWPTRKPGNPKPRIRLNSQGLWWCSDAATYGSGWGKTVKEAYAAWRAHDSKRFTMPRAGCWNKKGCMEWYRAGCPAINSSVGSRQIIAYDPVTDQLLLRGAK
jgi:hypothetical protein